MRKFKVMLFILPIAGALLAASRLDAYVFGGCGQWDPPEITFKINPNIVDATAGTAEEQVLAHLTGAYTWNNEGASFFDFQYGGTSTINTIANDGENVLFAFGNNGYGVLAETWCHLQMGGYVGFDIRYYDGDVEWSGPGDPTLNEIDIWSVTAHEMGHALGLGHSQVFVATMWYAYHLISRDLDTDDIEGVQARYGGQPDIAVRMIPGDQRAEYGPSGGTWAFDARAENTTGSSRTVDVWFDVRLPSGGSYGPVLGPVTLSFSPGQVREAFNLALQVPPAAPAGIYVVRMKVGDYPNVVDDESDVAFLKTAAAGLSEGDEEPEGLTFESSEKPFE